MMKWISVENELPREDGFYLCWENPYIYIGHYDDYGFSVKSDDTGGFEDVTHWMPLPDPPDENKPPEDVIEDGFGNAWSAYCPECGQRTMQVIRPGKCQCSECG